MAWIKRNLIFVICIGVAVLLTGYGAYLLFTALSDNDTAKNEYDASVANLAQVQQKAPFPSSENIAAAKKDQANVQKFLGDFRKVFSAIPLPPHEDEQGFNNYLKESLVQFRESATNAGVQLPADYAFGFSGLMGKLNFPPANIGPWMQQLQEIRAILNVLYTAQINSLVSIQRVQVSGDDVGGNGETLPIAPTTNQWGIITPYKLTFRTFSEGLASALAGFARSSNAFIVHNLEVVSEKQENVVGMAPPEANNPMMVMPAAVAAPRRANPMRGGANPFLGGAAAAPPPPAPMMVARPQAPAGPVTVLAEGPLLVTLSLDVVKLNSTEK